MVSRIAKALELKFWDFAIPMLSNSTRLRRWTAGLLSQSRVAVLTKGLTVGLVTAIAGILCGFFVYALRAILT